MMEVDHSCREDSHVAVVWIVVMLFDARCVNHRVTSDTIFQCVIICVAFF